MATYIILGNFTEQGMRNVRGSPGRTKAVADMETMRRNYANPANHQSPNLQLGE